MVNKLGPGHLRVHIVPVGFEVARVVEPLVRLRADRVHLVTSGFEDAARSYWEEILKRLGAEYPSIEARRHEANLWSYEDLLHLYRSIILGEAETGNLLFVNVSTGTKVCAAVGILASMLWGTNPYYVRVAYPPTRTNTERSPEAVTDIDTPPILRIDEPPETELAVVEVLRKKKGSATKEELIHDLRERSLVPSRAEISNPATYNRLRNILESLRRRGYVTTDDAGKGAKVKLTAEGKQAISLLRP